MNAKGGLFFKTVFIRSIRLSQFLQFEGIRSMRQQQLYDHFADFIHLLRSGPHDQIFLNRVKAGRNVIGPAANIYFHRAKPATPMGSNFSW